MKTSQYTGSNENHVIKRNYVNDHQNQNIGWPPLTRFSLSWQIQLLDIISRSLVSIDIDLLDCIRKEVSISRYFSNSTRKTCFHLCRGPNCTFVCLFVFLFCFVLFFFQFFSLLVTTAIYILCATNFLQSLVLSV